MHQRWLMVLVVTVLAAVLVSSCGGGEEGKNGEEESQGLRARRRCKRRLSKPSQREYPGSHSRFKVVREASF
jgi:hypothetical protein